MNCALELKLLIKAALPGPVIERLPLIASTMIVLDPEVGRATVPKARFETRAIEIDRRTSAVNEPVAADPLGFPAPETVIK